MKGKLYIKFNLGDEASIIDGCFKGERGKVARIIYDATGLKYDIITYNNKLCSAVPEEDLN